MTTTHGFTLLRDEEITEYQTRARLYRHDKTGAELLSLYNQDENKVFGITFRTPPDDSTGVAHILEHSVLCGSRNYPLKEPFVELLKGSLQTFLNAFTYPDKTCYPVASQNLKDFYNLIDIYMDAALHPLLSQATFDQEAWHYEIENPDQPLIYKGVVFNEMKGVYASADSLLGEMSQRVLFPGITYGHDYGGDPRHIPDLTWEQLRAFHQRYYHPSNARIFFCGDDDPTERLRRMDAVLSEYDRAEITSAIPPQPATQALTPEIRLPYPASEEEAHLYLTVNWRLRDGFDAEHTMGLGLLDRILTDTPASPLRKALLESGLGEDLTGIGVETQLHELYFSTGLKGIKPGDESSVIRLIEQTLASLVTEGLDPKTIEAAINTAEFELRELNTGSFPRGLSMMIATLQTWLYEGDPLAPLRYQAPLDAIKARLARGERYFEDLIQQNLIANPHRAVLILEPDAALKNRQEQEEADKLAAIKSAWTPEQIDAAIQHTAELKRLQATPDSPEALQTLPGLSRTDLEPRNKQLPIEVATLGITPFIYHDLFTQGITYLDVGLNLNVVPDDLLSLVPIWSTALFETGSAREDFVALSQRIGRETGGIRTDYYASAPALGTGESQTWLFLRGKATDDRLDALLAVLDDVFTAPRLDLQDRLKQIIAEEKAELESDLIPAGHRFVAQRLRARFSLHDWVLEQTGGISFLKAVRTYANQVERDWPVLLEKLRTLHHILTARTNLLINVTADGSVRAAAEQRLAAFLDRRDPAASTPAPREQFRHDPATPPEGLLIPAQVNYVGKSINLLAPGARISGHALVVNRYIRSAWLWDQVRVQGGAYGGFSMIDPRSGQLVMVSYRDPNLTKTLAIYDRTGDYLQALAIDDDEVTRAVIGAIGDLDGYLLPDAKGYLALCRHLAGDTVENRQRLRDEVLATTLQDFHAFGEQLQTLRAHGQVVVMGSAENLRALPDAIPTPVL